MSSPSVSLCIPVWRPRAAHLRALLASIARQRVRSLEVVVVDDGHTEGLGELVAGSAVADATVYCNERRLGMVANWNEAVRRSAGELVMLLGQDDELGEGLVEQYVAALGAVDGASACSSAERWIDDDGRPLSPPRRASRRECLFVGAGPYVLDQAELVRLCLRNGQVYGEPSAVMFRRDAFDAVGGYHAEFGHVADLDLDLRLAAEGPVVYLTEALVRRRIHPAMATRGQQVSGETADDREHLHDAWVGHPGLAERDRGRARAAVASWAARDLVRAVAHRRWTVARRRAVAVARYGRTRPRHLVENAVELVTGRNRDAF